MTATERLRVAAISATPLSVDRLLAAVSTPEVGGIAVFVGVVRNHDSARAVESLDYSAHPLAESVLRGCAEEVAGRIGITAVAVEHRIGHLEVGDLAVVVVVAGEHRHPALEGCRDLIDTLKERVPIWKEQHFSGGEIEWVGLD